MYDENVELYISGTHSADCVSHTAFAKRIVNVLWGIHLEVISPTVYTVTEHWRNSALRLRRYSVLEFN